MTTLVLGASGATGHRLVQSLLRRGEPVRVIVRSRDRLPETLRSDTNLSILEASLLDLSDADIARQVEGCDAIASCLGHTLSVRGMFGPPRRLVTEALKRLTGAVRQSPPSNKVRVVLMCSAGVGNRDLAEPISLAQRVVIGLLRGLLPPHADNEAAAEYLRTGVGPDNALIEWVVVRPDALIESEEVTPYETHPSPKRSAIFDSGKTSRINVADFMARLIVEDKAWDAWQGRMPVIYNSDPA